MIFLFVEGRMKVDCFYVCGTLFSHGRCGVRVSVRAVRKALIIARLSQSQCCRVTTRRA